MQMAMSLYTKGVDLRNVDTKESVNLALTHSM